MRLVSTFSNTPAVLNWRVSAFAGASAPMASEISDGDEHDGEVQQGARAASSVFFSIRVGLSEVLVAKPRGFLSS